jgi:hypothetical protein
LISSNRMASQSGSRERPKCASEGVIVRYWQIANVGRYENRSLSDIQHRDEAKRCCPCRGQSVMPAFAAVRSSSPLRSMRSSWPARPNCRQHVPIARRSRHRRQEISCRTPRRSRPCRRTTQQSRRSRRGARSGPIAASPADAMLQRPFAPISELPAKARPWSACAESPRRRRGRGIDGLLCVP